MSRRRLILLALPALALLAALVVAQLPRWTAPQANWFPANTPGVCAAVESLALYQAQRGDANSGIGSEAARTDAAQIVTAHYDTPALDLSDPLAVEATLPGKARQAYYIVTARLSNASAVIYLDAATGEPRALITATADPAEDCSFNVKAALVAAAKSPPLILLIAYLIIAAGAIVGALILRRLNQAKGLPQ